MAQPNVIQSQTTQPVPELHLQISQFFREKGVRYTPQRQLVLTILQQKHGHLTVEEIYQEVTRQFSGVNLSTIYRTLELLCELGVLVKMHSPDEGQYRFEIAGAHPHYHYICEKCGIEIEVADQIVTNLRAAIFEQYGFRVNLNHFLGSGQCAGCKEKLCL